MHDFLIELINKKNIVIFGAGIMARTVWECIKKNVNISSFMVSDKKNNPQEIDGKKVISIEEGSKYKKNTAILVAVIEKHLEEVVRLLKEEGFEDIIPISFESELFSILREEYYKSMCKKQGREYIALETELKTYSLVLGKKTFATRIYRAKCHVDKVLESDTSQFDWEIPIQVGASLTNQAIASVQDNMGENISEKNKEYCELTALYWIWKNDKSKYVGLCHYRRHFDITMEDLMKLEISDIDIVVTVPILNFPSVGEIYANDHSRDDWNVMMEAIKKLSPEYVYSAIDLQNGQYYYGYNMFIARKEILDDYCAWLFPILEYCEKRIGRKENTYQNRYIGFLAERLLSIYILHNQDKYKIVHAKKKFLMK